MNSLAEFWSKLRGPLHPEDKRFFDAHPEVGALFQQRFVPSPFFGDVTNSRVLLCFANGGKEDDQEFYKNKTLQAALLAHIRNAGPIDPSQFFTYFQNKRFVQWISDGQAVFVNAVAYRSANTNLLKENNTREIPSVRIARSWVREACAEAMSGRKFIVFHRWKLWGVTPNEFASRNIVFSTNPVSEWITDDILKRVESYLASVS